MRVGVCTKLMRPSRNLGYVLVLSVCWSLSCVHSLLLVEDTLAKLAVVYIHVVLWCGFTPGN